MTRLDRLAAELDLAWRDIDTKTEPWWNVLPPWERDRARRVARRAVALLAGKTRGKAK